MAREPQPREDLLKEATALVQRAEYRIAEQAEPIVIGFRHDGSASFFLGADPVYQFNAAGELRRAFTDGKLIKAERGRLVSLTREASSHQTLLVRHELSDAEAKDFLTEAENRLSWVRFAVGQGHAQCLRCVPDDADMTATILEWFREHEGEIRVAKKPHVGPA